MFAKVAPIRRMPSALNELDYLVDSNKTPHLQVGHLVHIPFRNRLIFGIVTKINTEDSNHSDKIKTIEEKIFDEVAFSEAQLNFLKEISEFYKTPLGFVLKSALLPLKKTKLAKLHLKKITPKADSKPSKPQLSLYKNNEEKITLFKKFLPKNGQLLILVPEVSAIDAVMKFLPADSISIHSDLKEKEIFKIWHKIRNEEIKIIVGTRLALFLPFTNLLTVIIDDEANPNHKSYDMAPRLHAREAALMLAFAHRANCILSGHTPAVETQYFAASKIYNCATSLLPLHPNTEIVDMREERRGRNYGFLSAQLQIAIDKVQSGDIFLFLNRKGTANYVGCRDCGLVAKCENCQRGLVYHESTSTLECHFCRLKKSMFLSCPKCHGPNVIMYGVGTELVENELRKKQFPKYEIIRLDAQTNNARNLNTNKNKIIIGTQIAWDKIDWSKISLMAFLEADTALFVPEYKMSENVFYQLRDAQYRLNEETRLIIQSSHPEHHSMANLASVERFYVKELQERRLFNYPPFYYLIRAYIGQKNLSLAQKTAQNVANHLKVLTKGNLDIIISDPLPFASAYTKGAYWFTLLIKTKFDKYKQTTKWLAKNLPDEWKFDPNPANLLSL